MPTDLAEQHRKKLDGIVARMVQNGEPDDNIKLVVGDFKRKYSSAATIPGMEKLGALPGVQAPLPKDLRPTDPNTPIQAMDSPFTRVGRGLARMANEPAAGFNDTFRAASEPLIEPALMAAPFSVLPTLGAVAGGAAAHAGGRLAATAIGASPDAAEATGNIASVPGAILGGGGAGALSDSVGSYFGARPNLANKFVAMLPRQGKAVMDFLEALKLPEAKIPKDVPVKPTFSMEGAAQPGSAPMELGKRANVPVNLDAPPPAKPFDPTNPNWAPLKPRTQAQPVAPIPQPQAAPTPAAAPDLPGLPPGSIALPEGSLVSPNAPRFKHPAEHTDLMRQIHANAQAVALPGSPAGKGGHAQLKSAAAKIYGVKSVADLTYEQLLHLNESLLKTKFSGLLE